MAKLETFETEADSSSSAKKTNFDRGKFASTKTELKALSAKMEKLNSYSKASQKIEQALKTQEQVLSQTLNRDSSIEVPQSAETVSEAQVKCERALTALNELQVSVDAAEECLKDLIQDGTIVEHAAISHSLRTGWATVKENAGTRSYLLIIFELFLNFCKLWRSFVNFIKNSNFVKFF